MSARVKSLDIASSLPNVSYSSLCYLVSFTLSCFASFKSRSVRLIASNIVRRALPDTFLELSYCSNNLASSSATSLLESCNLESKFSIEPCSATTCLTI
jgi:hypothetical protein